ncbi:MAG TPA: nucleotidyltransferase family protein [Allosphingosinicella sp.]
MRDRAKGVDWGFFLKVVRRHRVEGLAHDSLKQAGIALPAAIGSALAAEAQNIARQNLFFAAEAGRLHALLERASVAHLFVKGVTLNILAYASLALKRSCDIDLLVAPESYADACALLEQAGYVCTMPGPSRSDMLRYSEAAKDTLWRHPGSGLVVELHRRLMMNPLLLPQVTARSPRQEVAVATNVVLPTLARDELFAYLCAHGAVTAWSRLKWAADVAALLEGEDEAGLEALYRRALALRPGRSIAQALLLLRRLFDLPLGADLAAELESDPVNRWLVRTAMRTMVQGGAAAELHEQRFGTARINLGAYLLGRGWRYKAREALQKLASVRSRGASPIPDGI